MNLLIAIHISAVVCWFAGLFYLPRLFVYHAATNVALVQAQFKLMEYKLYNYIMMPAMGVTLFSGMFLLIGYMMQSSSTLLWLWLKLFLVLLLILFHFFCGYCVQVFANDENRHSHKFYRVLNEIPTLLLIAIVFLAVLKPF